MWMALALIMSFEKENGIDIKPSSRLRRERQTIGRTVLSRHEITPPPVNPYLGPGRNQAVWQKDRE
jgi:hypothetical protein